MLRATDPLDQILHTFLPVIEILLSKNERHAITAVDGAVEAVTAVAGDDEVSIRQRDGETRALLLDRCVVPSGCPAASQPYPYIRRVARDSCR